MHQAIGDLESRPGPLARAATLARGWATVSALAWSLVLVGVVVRLVRYADNRALWHDEAMLALNLLERGFLELLRPLDYVQAAPPAFLLLEKLAVVTLGPTEYALRLLPLLAGIAALVVFRRLTARVLPGLPGLVALGLFAVAEPLVYWSAEAKQYSLDVLAAVVLLYVVADPLLTGRLTARRAALAAAVGAVSLLFSYAAAFVLAGVGAAFLLTPLVAGRRPSTPALALVAAWALGLLALLPLIAATTADVRTALDLGTGESGTPYALARDAWRALSYPGPFAHSTAGLVVLVAVFGGVRLRRRCLPVLAALTLPILATAAAAQAFLYPFFGRFVLFLVPLVLLLVGAGVEALREATAGRTRAVWVTALVVLTIYPAGLAAANLVEPPKLEETKDVLRPLEERWRPGDSVFVARLTQPALAYYAECEACSVLDGEPSDDFRRLVLSARSPDTEKGLRSRGRLVVGDVDHYLPFPEVAARLRALQGEPRAWVLLSSGWDHDFVAYTLDCLGRRLEGFESTNAAAYLYDFSAPVRSEACPSG